MHFTNCSKSVILHLACSWWWPRVNFIVKAFLSIAWRSFVYLYFLFSIIKKIIYTDDKKPTLARSIFLITLAMTCTIKVHIHCDHMLLYKGNNCWPSTFFFVTKYLYASQIVTLTKYFITSSLARFPSSLEENSWLTVANEAKALRFILLSLLPSPLCEYFIE